MKKLVFGAAALAASLAFASEEIASANVVGYTTRAIPQFTSLVAPTMNNVTDNALKLADLKPSRSGGDDISSWDIQMQTLDDGGATEDVIVWMTTDDVAEAGWYYDDGETPYSKEFDFGEGIVISSEYDDTVIQNAGQVDFESTQVSLPQFTSVLGNTRPVALNLANIIPSRTGEDAVSSWDIQMQTLDDGGATEDVIVWMTTDDVAEAGWYYDDGETPYTKTLAVGEAIVISSEYDDTVLTLPSLK